METAIYLYMKIKAHKAACVHSLAVIEFSCTLYLLEIYLREIPSHKNNIFYGTEDVIKRIQQ